MSKLKIAIVRADTYSGNRGVGALGLSTLYMLNMLGKEFECEFEIYVINNNYGSNLTDSFSFGSETVKVTNLHPINFFNFIDALKTIIMAKKRRTLKYYPKLDYVLDMGAGDSFSDIYGEKRFYSVFDQHRMTRLFKKKLLLLPQTIGPFNDVRIKRKANRSIEKANYVFARDNKSLEYINQNTTQSFSSGSIDVAFFLPYKKEKFSKDFIHVGLNISGLLWNGGYTKNNQFNLKTDYQKLIHSLIEFFLGLPNVKLHLVPHVLATNDTLENDYAVSFNLYHFYKAYNIILAPFFLDPILAKNYIAGLDFFSGARMHSTIAAFSSGVPVFPLAYSKKFNGLYIDTLKYNYIGDMVKYSNSQILGDLKVAFQNRDKLKTIVEEKLKTTVKEKENIIKKNLADFLGLTR
uniref:polysaccharide pyruvyl transferase family protein n=1 Tax=uncultured Draconibacterium sp. TaxID=1573823 RepID=UPI003217148A